MLKRILTVTSILLSAPAFSAGAPELDVVTTFGSLMLVVGLILSMAWLLKKMRLPAMGSQKDLKILRQLPIGTRERVAVVQAGEEQFLIGITSQSINLISRLDKPIEDEVPQVTPFANQLTQLLKKDEKK
jgi:flagellar protein FliO/FliZ